MSDSPEVGSPSPAAPPASRTGRWPLLGLGLALIAAVYVAGSPSLNAPWILGDEYMFIVRNAEVTGQGVANDSPWQRLQLIFRFPPQEDLYQPLPILTYAVQWSLWGDSALAVRRLDVLLHAANALLLWWLFTLLLTRCGPALDRSIVVALAWVCALFWALHPALVSTYAADMGRTHLLSAAFALLSLGLHVRALETGRTRLVVGALLALLAAMLCKPVVGWIAIVLVLEIALVGWRRCLASPRIYLVGVLCVAFAILTYWTSQRSGVAEDAAKGLFGDPVSRSALAVWIYFRDLVAPLWLSTWHLPDPRTNWGNPLVWLGVVLTLASVVHAQMAWRQPDKRRVTIGWAWCWALLLPVIGLVGAREAAATDRYLYQPLMGVLLVVGAVILRVISKSRAHPGALVRPILVTGALLGAGLLLFDLPQVMLCRSSLRRGERIAQLNPGDPRALEALAVAEQFAAGHELPADDHAAIPPGAPQDAYFAQRSIATLKRAAALPDVARYFPGPADRAPFHRRLSYMFMVAGDPADSLSQAEAARALQPDAYLTWVRLAQAYQGLKRWDDAQAAYTRAETLLPDDPQARATHFTDLGYLLLWEMDRADLAYPKFAAAIATSAAPDLAFIGLALCEIRVGLGERGAQIVSGILQTNSSNALAALVLAEYYLRSHRFDDAARLYSDLVRTYPDVYARLDWYYEALRGFDSVCTELGRWSDAARAWDRAARQHPDIREFRSFHVWSAACAEEPDAKRWADELLAADADNPLACLAHALTAARERQIPEALEWVRRAHHGEPIPRAREFDRAARVFALLREQGKLPDDAALVEALIYGAAGKRERGIALLDAWVPKTPTSQPSDLLRQIRTELSDAKNP